MFFRIGTNDPNKIVLFDTMGYFGPCLAIVVRLINKRCEVIDLEARCRNISTSLIERRWIDMGDDRALREIRRREIFT